jgi:hypothetical protein
MLRKKREALESRWFFKLLVKSTTESLRSMQAGLVMGR